ncbi:MAG: tetratricopeptide repeat protein [Anaerolineae bacterium]|nr:tetratricopeptide repeat protein [Anaerolineae bacterium]
MKLRWPWVRRALAQQHYERALAFYDAGKIEMAVADLSEAIRHNHRRADLYAARGLVWAELGEYPYAEYDFETARRLSGGAMIAHYGLGMVAYFGARYDEAIYHFSRALERDPERAECYYFRSVCHYENAALDQAEVDMSFARQLLPPEDPRQLDAARWLGVYRREREKIRRRPRQRPA